MVLPWILIFGLSTNLFAATGEKSTAGSIVDAVSRSFCNAEIASRPPSLEALRSTLPANAHAPSRFEVPITLPEVQLVSELLGADSGVISFESGFSRSESSEMERRKFALAVCSASLTPGAITELMKQRPKSWLEAKPIADGSSGSAGVGSLVVEDREGRFGPINAKWFVPGWIVAHEVVEFRSSLFRYSRLVHPVSQSMKALLVYRQGISTRTAPVAFLRLADRPSGETVPALLAASSASWSPAIQEELDLARLEVKAFRKISESESQSGIRAEWELARLALAKAYADWKPLLTRSVLDPKISDEWLKLISTCRVNQSSVEVVPYISNPQVEKILAQWDNGIKNSRK